MQLSQTCRRALGWLAGYLLGILIGVDVLLNALLAGAPYNTISCRVGLSIQNDGWASHVPWPAWWRDHCAAAIYTTVV